MIPDGPAPPEAERTRRPRPGRLLQSDWWSGEAALETCNTSGAGRSAEGQLTALATAEVLFTTAT